MNIISRIILGIIGGLMKRGEDGRDKTIQQITLGATDAAIVFRHNGAHFIYPAKSAVPPEDMLDTLDYLRYALQREDWLTEWVEELQWSQAMTDDELDGERPGPRFEVIDGGKPPKKDSGPFAAGDDDEDSSSEEWI